MKPPINDKILKQSKFIKEINELIAKLDIKYLKEVSERMIENHSMRESAAILNPSPFTHNEQQDLNASKLKQLDLMIGLAKNFNKIKELTIKLYKTKESIKSLANLFES